MAKHLFKKGNRFALQHKVKAPVSIVEGLNTEIKIEYKRNSKDMIAKQIEKAKAGYLPAFIYLTDRVLGRPVESFRIAQVVKLVMGPED